MKKILSSLIAFILIVQTFLNAQTHQIKTDVYFGMNYQAGEPCYYNNGSGCRLYKLSLEIIRSEQTGIQSISVYGDSLKQVLPDNIPCVTAGLNSDANLIGFMATGSFNSFSAGKLYVYNKTNNSYTLVSNGSYLSNQNGSWIKWLNDSSCLYTSVNYCPTMNTLPGCGTSFTNRFDDLRTATGNFKTGTINSHNIVLGEINNITNLNSKVSSGQDASVNPIDKNKIAFHSTSIDGYPFNGGNNLSPFNIGQTNIFQDPNGDADPKPVVFDITSSSKNNLIDSLVSGTNYWLFDLESAKINSLVHLHWSPDGSIVAGNEQNTNKYTPYMECVNNPGVQISSPTQCSNSSKKVTFERVYGFEQVGNTYKNIMRTIDESLPLFKPLPPAQLPNSNTYFNPSTDLCSSYRTKYIEFCGSNKTILATVMCNNATGNQNPFSRIMLIDFTLVNNPYYFDLTGWIEQNYPTWQPGEAHGFSTTSHIISDTLLQTTSVIENINNNIILYPNPSINSVNIQSKYDFTNAEINIYTSVGQNIRRITGINEQNISISTSDLPNGIYFLILTNEGSKFIEKIIIKRE
ncbi:MAG: T9SS type A sorting domain-containing protein [Bacteroidia bacterium]|nr:T9SS type A sorting domain-containing protein [Bacteroidia bacterium]